VSGGLFGSAPRYSRDELQRFIDAIREHGADRGLTKWEADFVDSVAEQLERRGTLTDTQIDKLDAIYAERTP
jgi:hypothetical protein